MGSAAKLSVEVSLSALGPGGVLGSEFFGWNFAKYPGARWGTWQRTFGGGNLVSGLRLMGFWQRTFKDKLQSALGLMGGLGSKLSKGKCC